MRKSTLFVSAALTTFMLVMLFGAVSAYQAMTKTNPINVSDVAPVAQQQPVSSIVDIPPAREPTPQAALVTPEQAAQLAAQVINRTDLYSVETSKLNDVEAFLVTFSSGDLVYVSLTGQILSITKLPVVTVSSGGGGGGGGRRNNDGGGGGREDGKHEDGEHEDEEHEGGDD